MGKIAEYLLKYYRANGKVFNQYFGEIKPIPQRPPRGLTIENLIEFAIKRRAEWRERVYRYDFNSLR